MEGGGNGMLVASGYPYGLVNYSLYISSKRTQL